MNLIRKFTAVLLLLSLSACFQTALVGPTGHSGLAVTELRSGLIAIPATQATETWGPDSWANARDDWDDYPPFLQLLLLGVAPLVNTDGLDPAKLYLVTASGGSDHDPKAITTQPDPDPEPVQGSWHAIASGARIQAGNLKVSALTEAIYQQVLAHLSIYNDDEVAAQLDAAAQLLVTDVDKNGLVDYNDALRWSRTVDATRYLGNLNALDELAVAITAGQPNAVLASQAQLVYGSNRVSLSISYGNSAGVIEMETLNWDAPIGAANFLQYVRDDFYTEVFVHRVRSNFMIQTGIWGIREGQAQAIRLTAELRPEIFNESRSGVSNLRATVAYARTSDPHSASSQFFINQVNNLFLDYGSDSNPDGYTVFARVTSGMDVVDDIATLPVRSISGISEAVPSPDVVLESAVISN
jgi:cyclophilin family peptidyl-prolyl cis-trans isomerase